MTFTQELIDSLPLKKQDWEFLCKTGSLDEQECRGAAKLGFLQALAEEGMNPSDVEAMVKQAQVMPYLNYLTEIVGGIPPAMMILGGTAGALSGVARYNVEKDLEGKGDSDVVLLRKKLQGYQTLAREIKDSRARHRMATPDQRQAPAPY